MTNYCPNCGAQLKESDVGCEKCGNEIVSNVNACVADKPSIWLKIVSLLFPIIGFILCLVNIKKRPVSAKAYGVWSLAGIVINMVLALFI